MIKLCRSFKALTPTLAIQRTNFHTAVSVFKFNTEIQFAPHKSKLRVPEWSFIYTVFMENCFNLLNLRQSQVILFVKK